MAVADISHCAFYSPQLPLTLGPSLSQKIHKMHVNFYVSFSRAATPPSPRQDPNLSHGPAPTLRTLRGEAGPARLPRHCFTHSPASPWGTAVSGQALNAGALLVLFYTTAHSLSESWPETPMWVKPCARHPTETGGPSTTGAGGPGLPGSWGPVSPTGPVLLSLCFCSWKMGL